MKKKYRGYLVWSVKILITILASFFIYNRLLDHRIGFSNFTAIINQLKFFDAVFTLSLVIILMVLNWVAEAYKWQIMIASVHKIKFYESLCAIVCGLTLGTVTPNRIGDVGVRIMLLPKGKRIVGTVVAASGGFAKIVVVHMLACFALPVFLYLYKPELNNWLYVITFTLLFYIILLIYFYFNIDRFSNWMKRFRWFIKYKRYFEVISTYDQKFQLKILLIAFFRFSTLIVQYYLLLNLILPFINFSQVMLMVILLITIQSAIPSIDILDLTVRGVAALFLFGLLTNRDDVIIAVTAIIWFINLIIPALIGLILIFIIKQSKQTGALRFRFTTDPIDFPEKI